MDTVDCPKCGHEQSDLCNGGDPREWWSAPHGGEHVDVECDECQHPFMVNVEWDISLEVVDDDKGEG